MKIILLTFACLLFAGSFSSVNACSCVWMETPTCAIGLVADSSPVVFSGQVTEIQPIKAKIMDGKYEVDQKLVKFAVFETFRGTSERTIEVQTGNGGGDCGYPFQTGINYLVYTYKDENGRLGAGICGRTKKLDDASEDLGYFRDLAGKQPIGSIFGRIHESKPYRQGQAHETPRTIPGVQLTIAGPSGTFEAKTDEEGKYNFEGLLPGEYLLKMKPPAGLSLGRTEQKLKVVAKACTIYNTSFTKQTSVSGRVLDSEGRPPAKTAVALVPIEEINKPLQSDIRWIDTDENGYFSTKMIAPGRYYLGFRIDRISGRDLDFPATFYPGTGDINKAAVFTIGEETVLENLDFQLLPKFTNRRIEGTIVFPDGKPVANPYLCPKEITGASIHCGGSNFVVKDGKFSFDLIDGLEYKLRVHVDLPTGGQKHAEPVAIPRNGSVKDIKLVVSENGGTCSKCIRD